MQTNQDEELRAAALKRIGEKREFLIHAVTYVAVNALIIAVWALADSGGFFWPVFPILGWGIGLVLHGLKVYHYGGGPSESQIEREMARLRR